MANERVHSFTIHIEKLMRVTKYNASALEQASTDHSSLSPQNDGMSKRKHQRGSRGSKRQKRWILIKEKKALKQRIKSVKENGKNNPPTKIVAGRNHKNIGNRKKFKIRKRREKRGNRSPRMVGKGANHRNRHYRNSRRARLCDSVPNPLSTNPLGLDMNLEEESDDNLMHTEPTNGLGHNSILSQRCV